MTESHTRSQKSLSTGSGQRTFLPCPVGCVSRCGGWSEWHPQCQWGANQVVAGWYSTLETPAVSKYPGGVRSLHCTWAETMSTQRKPIFWKSLATLSSETTLRHSRKDLVPSNHWFPSLVCLPPQVQILPIFCPFPLLGILCHRCCCLVQDPSGCHLLQSTVTRVDLK